MTTSHPDVGPLFVFTGGGTAGPVTPLLAVVAAVQRVRPEARFLWIGTARGPEATLVAAAGLPFVAIAAGKLRRYFDWHNFLAPFEVLLGLGQAFRVLGRERVAVVVSAGGFVAVPVIWAARLRRIPVHVHQQDLHPTLTNVLTAPFAASVSVAFEKSLKDFGRFHPAVTGNPVRPAMLGGSRERAVELWGLEAGVPTVLFAGGGTGALRLNALVREAMPTLVRTCQIIHLTGAGKLDPSVRHQRYHQFEFLTGDMTHAYAAADLVVTRAGLGTLSELAVLGKPTVIMPMSGTHQEANARFFADRGGAVYLDERQATPESLASLVIGLLTDAERRQAMGESLRSVNPSDAAERIAAAILTHL